MVNISIAAASVAERSMDISAEVPAKSAKQKPLH